MSSSQRSLRRQHLGAHLLGQLGLQRHEGRRGFHGVAARVRQAHRAVELDAAVASLGSGLAIKQLHHCKT